MSFRKLTIRALLTGMLLSGLYTSAVLADTSGSVTGSNVNVRSEASTTATVLAKMDNGQAVSILGTEGEFYRIQSGDAPAYIATQFVQVLRTDATVKGDSVNLRKQPSQDAEVLSQLSSGAAVAVKGRIGDWFTVAYGTDDAYIHKDYIEGQFLQSIGAASKEAAVESTYALITADSGVKFRSAPSMDADVITVLPCDTVVDVVDAASDWLSVSYNGTNGYINAEFASVRKGVKPSRGATNSKGQEIVAYAKQFMGTPYQWAGTDLNNGVDCSGFVYAVMKHFGISLNRSSRDMVNSGVKITKDQLQAGDLVFFDTTGANDGHISHVGLYMGNGQFIHSSNGKQWGVTTNHLTDDYYVRTYVTACRVLR